MKLKKWNFGKVGYSDVFFSPHYLSTYYSIFNWFHESFFSFSFSCCISLISCANNQKCHSQQKNNQLEIIHGVDLYNFGLRGTEKCTEFSVDFEYHSYMLFSTYSKPLISKVCRILAMIRIIDIYQFHVSRTKYLKIMIIT